MSHRTTAAVILLAGVVLAGFAVNAASEQAADQTQVTDEEIPVAINETVAVPAPDDALNWSHTVDIEINGNPTIDGDDYEWDATNGSVYWYNTSATRSADNASIDYSFGTLSGPTQAFATLFGSLAPILAILVLAIGGVVTLQALDTL